MMDKRRRIPRFLCAVLAMVMALLALAAETGPPERFSVSYDSQTRDTLVFLSDTQAPTFFEALRYKTDHNEEATQRILDQAGRESGMTAAFLLGDLTRAASNENNWKAVDGFLGRLKENGVPAFAAIGNHEYMWSSRNGERNFRKRFPQLTTLWYSVVIGPAAVIILNSNFDELGEAEKKDQQTFYLNALVTYDDDPTIRGILVCCHHAPFTNGTVVPPSKRVESDFVPPFIKAKKGLLFLSGHSHAAEHFVMHGKDFLVLGGGGGVLHPSLVGSARRYPDIFPIQSPRRMFHYVTVKLSEEGLEVTYHMLLAGLAQFEPVHRFTLKW